ncbi:hypothetical protein SLS62_006846 [Diatrype stigma]|uniref:DUF7924 domain-containing protein n=1 Tax=Diatrype stigma TaxID=117547 RepID=A0AAN9UPZ6_9PEZI
MSLSGMWVATAQTTALTALTKIFRHEAGRWQYSSVWENEAFANFTREAVIFLANGTDTEASVQSNGTILLNGTTIDWLPTSLGGSGHFATEESPYWYYISELPRALLLSCLTCALCYWWQVWLEHRLPGRSRRVEIVKQSGPGDEKVEGGEDGREEQVVKRWIAQGKVQRSSLSWGNTLLKWILDITIGETCLRLVHSTLEMMMDRKPFSEITSYWELSQLTTNMLMSFISLWPLYMFISHAVIPVQRRLPVRAAVFLLYTILFEALFRAAISWLINSELAQGLLRDITLWLAQGTSAPEEDLQHGDPSESEVQDALTSMFFPFEVGNMTLKKSGKVDFLRKFVPNSDSTPAIVVTPRPDIVYGYSARSPGPLSQAQQLSVQNWADISTVNNFSLTFPFVVVEIMAEGHANGNPWVAVSQCLGGYKTCVNVVLQLNQLLMDSTGANTVNDASFGIVMDQKSDTVLVAWKGDELKYLTWELGSFLLGRPKDSIQFRKIVKNIMDWGGNQRLKEIQDALDLIAEENRKAASSAARSRSPPEASGTRMKVPNVLYVRTQEVQ